MEIKRMRKVLNIITGLLLFAGLTALVACTQQQIEEPETGRQITSEIYVSLGEKVEPESRVTYDTYDHWSISTFSSGDVVGFYTLNGRQNPSNESKFDQGVMNEPMYYEGRIGSYYRFSNPDIVLDALTVGGAFSRMYYPYYPDMPATTDNTGAKGMPLRRTDSDGIEKCIDFMYSSNTSITLTNGMLQPTFNHYCGVIGIQRGKGFTNATDPRIWVVMQNPYTDIRMIQTSATSSITYSTQNTEEPGEDVMVSINPDRPDQKINKNRVWQCWQGADYNDMDTYYVLVPPSTISYLLIQNDLGEWKAVTDFYLYSTGSKSVSSNYRYMLKVSMQGLVPTVRPVIVCPWNEELRITDDRSVGIESIEEFSRWVSIYNSYVEQERNEVYVDRLSSFGDAVRSGSDGPLKWTFYINSNLNLEGSNAYVINKLEDVLEGSSVYTNYSVSNLRHSLIEEMGEGGGLRALDFDDLYLIDTAGSADAFCGGLIRKMSGGEVKKCNVRNGVVVSNKITGMVVGSLTGGSITDCFLSGDVIGSSTEEAYDGMFGSVSGSVVIESNDTRELNFTHYQ